MSGLPALPAPLHTWIAIDDPDAVCAAYERLWEHGARPGDPPFETSPAGPAVEAMAWDPWSHFDGTSWDSAWLGDGDRQVRVEAKAYVEADEGTPHRVGRRAASGVRVTDRSGCGPLRPPPEVRSGRLVLECALSFRDERGTPPTLRTRIEAGSVFTIAPEPPTDLSRQAGFVVPSLSTPVEPR